MPIILRMIIIYTVSRRFKTPVARWVATLVGVTCLSGLVACSGDDGAAPASTDGVPTIVVTTPMLGALVSDIVGASAEVTVLMPNGTDPHSWEPSAVDIEAVQSADLVVVNGLGLEGNLVESVDERRSSGRLVFDASRAVDVIRIDPTSDEFEEHPDGDPHFWTDPRRMADVATSLGRFLDEIGVDATEAVSIEQERLLTVDAEIQDLVEAIPEARRRLVTGHESMAYFAERYGFTVIGAVIPSQSSLAEASAADLAELASTITDAGVDVVFTEKGTPSEVVDALASDVRVRVVVIDPVTVPDGASFPEFLLGLGRSVVAGFRVG